MSGSRLRDCGKKIKKASQEKLIDGNLFLNHWGIFAGSPYVINKRLEEIRNSRMLFDGWRGLSYTGGGLGWEVKHEKKQNREQAKGWHHHGERFGFACDEIGRGCLL